MATEFVSLVDYFRYVFEVGLLCLIFSSGSQKKPHFLAKTILTAVACLSLGTPMILFFELFSAPYYIQAWLMVIWLLSSFRRSIWDTFWAYISAIMTKQAAWKLYNAFLLLIGKSSWREVIQATEKGQPLWYIGWYVLYAVFVAAVYYFLEKPLQGGAIVAAPRVIAISLGFFVSNLFLNWVDMVTSRTGLIDLTILLYLGEFLYSIMVLSLKYLLIAQAKAQDEAFIINELLKRERKRFEHMWESMDIIRMKSHDLRHQINRLKAGGVDDAWVQELSESISIYDSNVHTGNETLDVILSDKQLYCQSRGIALTLRVDGAAISFMDQADICSLFGNALENAIDYVSTLEPEKRFINLSVVSQGAMVFISVENYIEKALQFRDGLPISTQKDTESHGFGLRSIQMIARRYGGQMQVEVKDHIFRLSVILCPQ